MPPTSSKRRAGSRRPLFPAPETGQFPRHPRLPRRYSGGGGRFHPGLPGRRRERNADLRGRTRRARRLPPCRRAPRCLVRPRGRHPGSREAREPGQARAEEGGDRLRRKTLQTPHNAHLPAKGPRSRRDEGRGRVVHGLPEAPGCGRRIERNGTVLRGAGNPAYRERTPARRLGVHGALAPCARRHRVNPGLPLSLRAILPRRVFPLSSGRPCPRLPCTCRCARLRRRISPFPPVPGNRRAFP